MKKIILIIFCFLPVFLLSQSPDSMQTKMLKEISAHLQQETGFSAQFKQSRFLSIMDQPLVSEGVCMFKAKDKLRWEIKQPYASLLIYNSEQVAKFDVQQGKLKKMNFGGADIMRMVLQQIIAWMQGDFEAANSIYELRVKKEKTEYIVFLTPQSEALRKNLTIIELHFNNQNFNMQQVFIRESESDYIQIEFNNKANVPDLSEQFFDLNKPLLN